MSDQGVFKLSNIEEKPVYRLSTGFSDLDKIYGSSKTSLFDNNVEYGLPLGKISVWSGPGGIGKTRVAVSIASSVNSLGKRVLFFQNEASPSEFKTWTNGRISDPDNFYVSNYSDLSEQMKVIESVMPLLVVVDSVNMIEGFENPTQLRKIMNQYRDIVRKVGCHVIFIGHLNKMGDIKGNNDIEYLADVIARLVPHHPGVFILEINKKNRYGKIGGWVGFCHTDDGIRFLNSSINPNVVKIEPVKLEENPFPKEKPLNKHEEKVGFFDGIKKIFIGDPIWK
jgi:DNA repair protein RadA/Sms